MMKSWMVHMAQQSEVGHLEPDFHGTYNGDNIYGFRSSSYMQCMVAQKLSLGLQRRRNLDLFNASCSTRKCTCQHMSSWVIGSCLHRTIENSLRTHLVERYRQGLRGIIPIDPEDPRKSKWIVWRTDIRELNHDNPQKT